MLRTDIIHWRHLTMISAFLCFVFFSFDSASAQAGRRMPKVKSPAPVETPVPEPTPKPKKSVPVKPDFSLKVLNNTAQTFNRSFAYPEKMSRWVVERLKNSPLLEVQMGGNATMKEAQETAKNASDAFVILVELNENPFNSPTMGTRSGSREIWIDFTVLAPATGKVRQKGRAYLKPELLGRNRGVLNRTISCYPSLTDEDYLLWQASFETAERIMNAFNLPVPPLECDRTF